MDPRDIEKLLRLFEARTDTNSLILVDFLRG